MFRFLSTAVLLLLVALPSVALAQATGILTGTVVDEQGQTLIGANVRIEGTTLGAATNIDGEYRVIGVPIGSYDITASYTGYQPETQSNVPISANVNRVVDFVLGQDAALDEVVVEYERPLIERSAVGAPRAISGEDIQNLPVRGVNAVTQLQSGVVSSSQGLNIRGGRGGEVAYYVDGVRITGNVAVNQAAIAEQEMLIGTIPARYGDVQSGVISITTETGRSEFFGSLEGITSRGLDSYGYNVASLSLGGPLVSDKIGFFGSVEGTFLDDASPYGIESFRLKDDNFDLIQRRPQSFAFAGPDGETRYFAFPAELFDDRPFQTPTGTAASITTAQIDSAFASAYGDELKGFSRISSASPVPTASLFTEEDFDTQRGKDDPFNGVVANGSLNFNVLPSITLRLGGGYQNSEGRGFSYARSFYDRNYSTSTSEYYRVYGTVRQRVGTNSFYQITGEYQNDRNYSHPEDFSNDVRETLFYGDIDRDRNLVSRRYFSPIEGGLQRRNYQDSERTIGNVDPETFILPGATSTSYSKSRTEQFGVVGNATTQVGVHQVEFGGEYRQNTNRFFSVSTFGLARYYADGTNVRSGESIGIPEGGVENYEALSFQVLDPLVSYYGYDFRGLEETDGQDVEKYFSETNGVPEDTRIDAWRPYYYAGYLSDRIEFSDLIFDIGLRVDAYNANTLVLKDLFANRPIYRAGDLDGVNVPSVVGEDYGVYFARGEVGNGNVVGYRDLEGNQYNVSGEQVRNEDIEALAGRHVVDPSKSTSSIFRESDTDVTVMPRLGVSFPVTDRALFFASYNVVAQRPTQNSFNTFNNYFDATGSSRISNTGLEPQRTTQYELGFRQRVGERAALSLLGFYRTQDNLIALRNADGAYTPYSFYTNRDFSTSQGAEIAFELRRTNNLSLNANYTLSFAKATGSDASTLGVIAWRGDTFPNFISPADFDQRHTVNVTADYRFGAGEGPVFGGVRPFENFGVNVIGQFGSGQRYTPLINCGQFNVSSSFTCDTTGDINSATLPANYSFDLKLDRRFDLGFSDSKMQLYLLVLNVLDTKNVYAVYRETGQVDNQGYFNGALGAQRLSAFPNPDATRFNYQAYSAGPVNNGGSQSSNGSFYGSPRRIRLGALFTF